MRITISSVLTMCLVNSILILLLCFLFKRRAVMKRIGPECMLVLLLAVVVRMCFPFEFVYTCSVYIEEALTPLLMFLIHVPIEKPLEITVGHLLMILWVAGVIVSFLYKIYNYRKAVRIISLAPEDLLGNHYEAFHLDKEEYRDTANVRVIFSQQQRMPCLIGIRNPCLILPKAEVREDLLHYMILHEIMHIRKKDLIWKAVIDLLCTIFWWNLVLRYLKKELFQLVEMRNDMQIAAGLTEEERICYMECLQNAALQLLGQDTAFSIGFSGSDFRALLRRMQLLRDEDRFSHWLQVMLSVVVFVLLLASTAVIFEPYSIKELEEGGGIIEDMSGETTFLIRNGSQYDVYVDGEYLYTTHDIQPFIGFSIYDHVELYDNMSGGRGR